MLTQQPQWIVLEQVDSTNSWLCQHIKQLALPVVTAVYSPQQMAGRGRAGRLWKAIPGASLALSVALPIVSSQLSWLSLAVGIQVAEFLGQKGVDAKLKWPNDLLVSGRKLGGILCESFSKNNTYWAVVGVGLNIKPVDCSGALSGAGAISLAEVLGLPIDQPIESLAKQLAEHLALNLQGDWCRPDVLRSRFSILDAWFGEAVVLIENGVEVSRGKASGVAENGAYLLATDDGFEPVHVGDLSLRLAQ